MKSFDNEYLMKCIPTGEKNAIPMSTLALFLNLSERELRSVVLRARKDGCLIATSTNGYFQPETENEMLTYYRTRFTAAMSTLASLKATRNRLKAAGVDVECIENRGRRHGKEK